MRPRDPFQTPVSGKFNIEKKTTAAAQYWLAVQLGDNEDAWQAVIDFFPDENAELERRRSEEKLALVHLQKGHFDKAKELFKKLAILGSESGAFRANAYAGLAGIASLEGDFSKSQRIIAVDLTPAIRKLPRFSQLDPQMQSFMQRTRALNAQHLREKFDKDIDDLFQRAISNDELP